MRFKRRFDGFVSEDNFKKQLLCLIAILTLSYFLFWGISSIFFPGEYKWREIIALYLDPGVFDSYSENHTWFPLVITFVGIFVFTALLITVFSNIFSNISDAYKKGLRRYKRLSGHTLILGANRMLIRMLDQLKEEDGGNDILIMTSSPVEDLRDRIEAYFGDKKFMRRITIYFDERNNESNLKGARADMAKEIFIIGEDNEVDHDSVSISCCEKLECICKDSPDTVHCFLVLENQSSAEIYHYLNKKYSQGTRLQVDVLDIYEYVAEQTLLGMNGEGQLSIDGKGVRPETEQYVHFIISGMTPMAKAMALTAAHLCHFPNFDAKTGARKTVITFMDYDIRRQRDIFISEHQNLFVLSHYSDISFDEEDAMHVKKHEPDLEYGDFLDIAWEFVDADISSPEAKAYLTAAAQDPAQQLAVAICQAHHEDNMSAALHLPAPLYDRSRNIPIYVHLQERGDAVTKANETGQFGNIYCFGTGTSADKDPLFQKRLLRGQRVNYVYCAVADPSADPSLLDYTKEKMLLKWYGCKESDKFSSIYCANSMIIKEHSFGEDLSSIGTPLFETEHRRWVYAVLLLGKKAYPASQREELKEVVLKERNRYPDKGKGFELEKDVFVSPTWKALHKKSKEEFIHIDIESYEDLVDKEEKEKDGILMRNAGFILEKTDVLSR